jgi:serine/threonine protein kinase
MGPDDADELFRGRYRVTGTLGAGGMGRVLAAVQEALDRPVAIKILRSDRGERLATRFEREAKILSRLSHANIVAVYDFGRTPAGEPYVVMERIDGRDLRAVLRERGPLPPAESRRS